MKMIRKLIIILVIFYLSQISLELDQPCSSVTDDENQYVICDFDLRIPDVNQNQEEVHKKFITVNLLQ